MSEPIIGIDLGTTNSEVAIVENGRVTVISENDEVVLPSVVGLADDGAILVGTSAQNQFALYPERTVKSVKRLMGNDEQIQLGDNSYSPQEISAIILKTLKARAEKHLGTTVSKAVITVPAYFSDSQRRATREAGEIAGLEVVRMINEPTAAALAYEAGKNTDKTVLIYDLGGGTFDVSVVSVQSGVVEVLASHGNNHLGGDDFDSKIVGFIEQHLTERDANIDGDVKTRARIRRAAEQAKIVLSDKPYTRINEEFITHVNGQPLHLDIEITRADYEDMIEDYIDETFDAIQTALEGAGLTPDSIDEIVLVGGSSRTPVIGRRLKAIFKQQPHGEINPDLCVATGAAIQAATIAGESFSAVLVDITPYTFGTSVLGERQGEPYPFVYVPVIEKNSSLPLSKSDIFYTSFDGQASVEVNIYQGEDPDAINNIAIGQFTVEGLSDVEAGNPIVLSLNLDLNGILKVTALEKETGLQKSITIDNAISSFNEAEIEGAKTRIDALINNNEISPVESGAQEERPLVREDRGYQHNVQAQALVEKAERLLDDANGDDKEDLVDHIEAVKDALTAASSKALDSAVEGLTDLVYYLEV